MPTVAIVIRPILNANPIGNNMGHSGQMPDYAELKPCHLSSC